MVALDVRHRRTHNLLLAQRLLSCRDQISPFTLVLDSLQQAGWALVREMVVRAKRAQQHPLHVIVVSFETLRRPTGADVFLQCHGMAHGIVQREVMAALQAEQRNLVVFDSLHPLLVQDDFNATGFLSNFTTPTTSLLAIYHTSVPLPPATGPAAEAAAYAPQPLVLLRYLATAVLTVHALQHVLARKRALDRAEAPPLLGLEEGIEGVVVAMGSHDPAGSVVELEHRRRSGRSVVEWLYVPHPTAASVGSGQSSGVTHEDKAKQGQQQVILLEDHPLYPRAAASAAELDAAAEGVTFELGLSAEQRRERDKVVLPYFDAQSDAGVGQGGRILYDLGVEDDFDEEEDEI